MPSRLTMALGPEDDNDQRNADEDELETYEAEKEDGLTGAMDSPDDED